MGCQSYFCNHVNRERDYECFLKDTGDASPCEWGDRVEIEEPPYTEVGWEVVYIHEPAAVRKRGESVE